MREMINCGFIILLNRVLLLGLVISVYFLQSCMQDLGKSKNNNEVKLLTSLDWGHTLHHNNAFSKDDKWIVFDGRNDETKIGETATVGMVNVRTGEERTIYQTRRQTVHGPGVGAVSFSPVKDEVIFIHGLPDANEEHPYAMSRRMGMLVDIHNSGQAFPADARDTSAPYVAGSLRGGTHSHCWSPDGSMLSFTYNDEFVEPDLRVVGVMVPSKEQIQVDQIAGNNNGRYYSAIVTEVVANPKPGSDQISKAFDECWLPIMGHTGELKQQAIVFQGNTINKEGKQVTEIYQVDIHQDKILNDTDAVGKEGERPQVPKGITQKRLTHTERGLSDLRHWLRTSSDGQFIYALAKDDQDRNQIVQYGMMTGELKYISAFDFSIASPINISYQGDKITFIAEQNVYVYSIAAKTLLQLTGYTEKDLALVGAPVFSRKGDKIAFNQFVNISGKENVQIKIIQL